MNSPTGAVTRTRGTLTWEMEVRLQIELPCTRECSSRQQSIRSATWNALTFNDTFYRTRVKETVFVTKLFFLKKQTRNNHSQNAYKTWKCYPAYL